VQVGGTERVLDLGNRPVFADKKERADKEGAVGFAFEARLAMVHNLKLLCKRFFDFFDEVVDVVEG